MSQQSGLPLQNSPPSEDHCIQRAYDTIEEFNVVCLLVLLLRHSQLCTWLCADCSEWHFDCKWSFIVCLRTWWTVTLQILLISNSPSTTNV